MAQDASNKRSRRSSRKTKRKVNAQTTDQATYTKKERTTNALPKLGNDAMDKVPSNAPTMAIAPSDYEHIFHEGPVSPGREASPPPPAPPRSPQQVPATIPRLTAQGPASPTNFHQTQTYQAPYMVAQPPTIAGPIGPQQTYQHQDQDAYTQDIAYGERRANVQPTNYPPEVLITPDGYNLLGHAPSSSRRNPLPPHIVRATNQFSRAALARVARYLASRAEQPR